LVAGVGGAAAKPLFDVLSSMYPCSSRKAAFMCFSLTPSRFLEILKASQHLMNSGFLAFSSLLFGERYQNSFHQY
jgi:hypothetical protein